jgi:hypothetical protein
VFQLGDTSTVTALNQSKNTNRSLRHAPLIRLGAARRSTFSHKGRREGASAPALTSGPSGNGFLADFDEVDPGGA